MQSVLKLTNKLSVFKYIVRKIPAELATRKPYTAKYLSNAVAEVKVVLVSAVAYKYRVPPTTLHDHAAGKHSKVAAGDSTIMFYSKERENSLEMHGSCRHGLWLDARCGSSNCTRLPVSMPSLIPSLRGSQGRIGGRGS